MHFDIVSAGSVIQQSMDMNVQTLPPMLALADETPVGTAGTAPAEFRMRGRSAALLHRDDWLKEQVVACPGFQMCSRSSWRMWRLAWADLAHSRRRSYIVQSTSVFRIAKAGRRLALGALQGKLSASTNEPPLAITDGDADREVTVLVPASSADSSSSSPGLEQLGNDFSSLVNFVGGSEWSTLKLNDQLAKQLPMDPVIFSTLISPAVQPPSS